MSFIYQLIIVLNAFLFESIVANLVTVGNYRNLNPEGCGLSRHALGMQSTCLEWHKGITSPIRGATDVRLGDAPWVALLHYSREDGSGSHKEYCTGSLFANQWILTSALCMNSAYNIEIYLGYNNTKTPFDVTNETHKHPHYVFQKWHYNMALVKMTKPYDTSVKPLLANNICMPEKWSDMDGTDCLFNPSDHCKVNEYGMAAGWGSGLNPQLTNAQVGYWRLFNYRYMLSPIPEENQYWSIMSMKRVDSQQFCAGDNGGPVWQYDLGRAVIVGVFTRTGNDTKGCEPVPMPEVPATGHTITTMANWVDQEIDWIKDVTKLN